jgi:hypothetical protein
VVSVSGVLVDTGRRQGHDETRLGERILMVRPVSPIVSWTDAEGQLERWRPAGVFWAQTVQRLRGTRQGGISSGIFSAARRPRWRG